MSLLAGRVAIVRVRAAESARKNRSPWLEGTARAGDFAEATVEFGAMDPANIAPFAAFAALLTTDHAADITGQTCIVYGGIVAHVHLPRRRNELFKEVGPSAYEGPRGNSKLPAH